jgi:hypothetical protein
MHEDMPDQNGFLTPRGEDAPPVHEELVFSEGGNIGRVGRENLDVEGAQGRNIGIACKRTPIPDWRLLGLAEGEPLFLDDENVKQGFVQAALIRCLPLILLPRRDIRRLVDQTGVDVVIVLEHCEEHGWCKHQPNFSHRQRLKRKRD